MPAWSTRSDPESIEDVDQPGDVVLVRVAQHEQVDAPREERQVRADAAQRELRVRTAVDQHRRAVRRLDEDRVALADVEHGQVEAPVRARRDRDREQHRHQAEPRSAPGGAADGQRRAQATGIVVGGRRRRCGASGRASPSCRAPSIGSQATASAGGTRDVDGRVAAPMRPPSRAQTITRSDEPGRATGQPRQPVADDGHVDRAVQHAGHARQAR